MRGKPYLTVLFSVLCLAALLAPAAGARVQPLTAAAPRGSTAPTGFLAGPLPDSAPASVEQMQALPPRFAGYNAIEDLGQTTIVVPNVLKEYYSWNTLLSIQNLTTATMVITVEIHLEPVQTLTNSVPAHSPWNLRMVEIPELPVMMASEATVSAPRPIAVAVVDESSYSLTAYDGLFGSGATELFVPVLYYNYFGWDSSLTVQNAGVVTTTVLVSYSDGTINYADVPPGEFQWFSQSMEAHDAPTFSAVVSADQPLRGYSHYVHGPFPIGESAQGVFTGGGVAVAVPLASKGYAGWDSKVVVQNVGSLTTNLTIAYEGYAGDAYSVTLGAAATYAFSTTAEAFLPFGYHGAAWLSSDNGQPLVAQVLLWQAEPTAWDHAASYNGVAVGIPGGAGGEEQLPAQPSPFRIHYPLAPKPASSAHDRWDAFLVVENVGTSAVTVTAEFFNAAGTSYVPADLGGFLNPFTLTAGASQVISMSAIPESGLPAGQDYAVVISSGQPVAGVAVLGYTWPYRLYLPLVPKASQL